MAKQIGADLARLLSLRVTREKISEQIYQQHHWRQELFSGEFNWLASSLIETEFRAFRDWGRARGLACYVLRNEDSFALAITPRSRASCC